MSLREKEKKKGGGGREGEDKKKKNPSLFVKHKQLFFPFPPFSPFLPPENNTHTHT